MGSITEAQQQELVTLECIADNAFLWHITTIRAHMLCDEIQSVKVDHSKRKSSIVEEVFDAMAEVGVFNYLCNDALESFSHYKLNGLVVFINKLCECQQLNGLFDTVRLELKKIDSNKSFSVSEHYQKLVDQTFSILHQDSIEIAFGKVSTIEEFASDVYCFSEAFLTFLTQLPKYGLGSTKDLLKNMQMKCGNLLNTTSDLSATDDVRDLYYDLRTLENSLCHTCIHKIEKCNNFEFLSKQVSLISGLLSVYLCTAERFRGKLPEFNSVSEKNYIKYDLVWSDIVYGYTKLLSLMFSITQDLQFLELFSLNEGIAYCTQVNRIQDYCFEFKKFKNLEQNKERIVARLEIIVESIMIGLVNNFILLVNLRLKEKRLTESSELTRVNHYLESLNKLRELTADTLADETIN